MPFRSDLKRQFSRAIARFRGERHQAKSIERLIQTGSTDQVDARLREALFVFPKSSRLNLLRAAQLHQAGDTVVAIKHVRLAMESEQVDTADLFHGAEMFELLQEYELANAVYERLSKDSCHKVASHALFRQARLVLDGDKKNALKHLTDALCLHDHDTAFSRVYSTNWTDQESMREALSRLRVAARSEHRGHRSHMVIADLLTKLEDFDSATKQVASAMRLRIKRVPAVREKVLRSVPAGDYDRRLDSTPKVQPSYLIIGAMKCGTTSLYNYINQHPDCIPAVRKEIRFFNNLDFPLDWYLAHYPPAIEPQFISGEASPSYYSCDIQQRIQSLFPDIKMICILRNPVHRAISQFHHARKNMRPRSSLERFLDNLEGFREINELDEDQAEEKLYQLAADGCDFRIAYGFYYYYLRRWFRYFDRDQLLLLRLQDLSQTPHQTMRRVFEFIGVSADFECEFRVENRGDYGRIKVFDENTKLQLAELYQDSLEKLRLEYGLQMDE